MMISPYILDLLLLFAALVLGGGGSGFFSSTTAAAAALNPGYYEEHCPDVDLMVKDVVDKALEQDPTLAASLLRMHFHDCFVQGCDGSVLIDSTEDNEAEKDASANLSLRGFEVIGEAKQLVERECPGIVSCADILAMVARDSVYWAGGPFYEVGKGRLDGRRSRIEDTVALPPPTANSTTSIRMFGQHGFTVQELVALVGGHTLGVTRCIMFKNRLSEFESIHSIVEPGTTDIPFAGWLAKQCDAGGDNTAVPFDETRNAFDTAYFEALTRGDGVLTSDQALYSPGSETVGYVSAYAEDAELFFADFARAMVKMGSLGIKHGSQGEIRHSCHKIN